MYSDRHNNNSGTKLNSKFLSKARNKIDTNYFTHCREVDTALRNKLKSVLFENCK